MRYINPIMSNSPCDETETEERETTKKISRSIRSDKTHNIKFPVNPILQMKLRTLCKHAKRINIAKGEEPLSQTKFNTLLLRHGLQNPEFINWQAEYLDTKAYMHTNILETEYQAIGGPYGYSITMNMSDRKVVHAIMVSMVISLERSGSIDKVLCQE
jgi:hypothetical protein